MGLVCIWDAIEGKQLASEFVHQSRISSLAWSPDKMRIAVAGEDCPVKIIDAETCEELLNLSDSTTQVSQLAWSPDGHQLAGIDSEGKIVVWDATRGYAYEDIQIKAKKEKEPSANRAEASKAVTSNK